MNSNLKDKVVFITGSTGGIGMAVTKAFAAEGARVAITSRSQDKLDALIAELGLDDDHVAGFVVDVSDEAQVKAAVEREQSDVCINSAKREQARPKVSGWRG